MTQFRSFDHAHLAEVPEYQAMLDAIQALDDALFEQGRAIPLNSWSSFMSQVARGQFIRDECPQCGKTQAPFKAIATPYRDTISAMYLCGGCGNEWVESWDKSSVEQD